MKKAALYLAVMTAAVLLGGCGGSSSTVTSQQDAKVESAKETATESKTESKTETKTESKTETKTESKTETATPEPTKEAEKQSTEITEDQAKEIALKDAGLKESDVTFTNVGRDFDDGIEKYDIDFRANGMEYDYDIDIRSGEILSKSSDIDDDAAAQAPATDTGITDQKALEIALGAANVSENDISNKQVGLDFDDDYGKMIYDVEFHVGMTEYSFDIDPDNGEILKSETGIDD